MFYILIGNKIWKLPQDNKNTYRPIYYVNIAMSLNKNSTSFLNAVSIMI